MFHRCQLRFWLVGPGRKKREFCGDDYEAAKAALIAARTALGLSRRAFAERLGIAPATLKGYECGASLPEEHITAAVDRLREQQAGGGVPPGQVTRAFFGETRTPASSFDRLLDLLNTADFTVGRRPSSQPTVILWMHKLREPHLVHAMFSLAAAAALKEGFEVRLLLDDSLIPTPSMRERLINDFRDAVTSWLDRAGAPTERFATTCYSEIVRGAPESAALAFVARFLNNETRASEFIEASKITRDRTAAAASG